MDCILLRHGIAEDREAWKGPESKRPLTKEGVRKTFKAVTGLKHLGIQPTHLISSPYTRAWETAQIAAQIFKVDEEIQVCEELLFHRSPADLFPVLAKFPKESCIICVGHEPHLGETAGVMIFGKTVDSLSLKKAGACGVTFEGKPQSGKGLLKWWMTPRQLRQLRQG